MALWCVTELRSTRTLTNMATTAQDSVHPVYALNDGLDTSSQDIEEGRDVYRPGGFHPIYIGDVYHDKYKVLNKIGYGVYSTVWLARDLQASVVHRCVRSNALPIANKESSGRTATPANLLPSNSSQLKPMAQKRTSSRETS